ncbi:MAG: DPP IV N-terminal domain-containing protein [Bacteroidaceae bacterium]|nr:DPP IV N-terminal domain-containing protein [Bacteroidaceae bacterium]
MKKILIVLSLLLSVGVQAQEERRLLSMEEAVLMGGAPVSCPRYSWDMGGSVYTYNWEDETHHIDARSGKEVGEPTVKLASAKKDHFKAFTRDGEVWYLDKDSVEHQITSFNQKGIVCGETVSRNEFGIEGGIFVSPDRSKIAFYKKDETRVTIFPLLDITTRTGSLKEIRYPMNGMESEIITLGVYDINKGTTVWMDVTDFDQERYLTNITWSPASDRIFIQVLDRAQKNMHLNVYDVTDGKCLGTLFTEHDERYVEPQHPLTFLPDHPDYFIYQTNVRDGYWNLYLGSVKGGEPKRIIHTDADLELVDIKDNYIYYYSFQVSPVERHLFRINIKHGVDIRINAVQRLTKNAGWHTCEISPDGKYFLDTWSELNTPRVVNLVQTDGKKTKELFRAADNRPEYNYCPIELGAIKSADGKYDNYYRLIKPIDFDPSKKYPVILYVYGGPHSQMVNNSFNAKLRTWEMYMAQHGYVVFVMDNRGTLYHGAEYEKAIHKYCGQAEIADQMEGMKWLMSHDWVDKDRIGVHGWSYGGFMTISLMVNYPEIFKVGVAGGPVIDWKWYEVMYGERYMETEVTNPEGFEKTSLIPRAKDLKGKLLICQGAIDNTVVWEHSLSFVETCIKEGIQLDYFPYPTHEHNVMGKDRVHLMQKVTDYFEEKLKIEN